MIPVHLDRCLPATRSIEPNPNVHHRVARFQQRLDADMEATTVLCTGGGGFLGRHVVQAMLDEGTHVRIFDLAPTMHLREVRRMADATGADARQAAPDDGGWMGRRAGRQRIRAGHGFAGWTCDLRARRSARQEPSARR